ncbi:MAG: gamma-glutamyltransferase [Acidobacteriota bacterium]|nr:gamma-glutamyltransferase [Acidobacteriota bacterium]
MKRIACAIATAIAIASPGFAGSVVIAKHAALATASPYATQIGLDVLKRGGNAIDAAVAVAFALAVAQPQSGNIGGGGFLVYYEASSHAVWTLDFREVAPASATRDMFAAGKSSRDGALAVGVPGTIAGLAEMQQRFGRLKWKELIAPAIRLAVAGVNVSEDLRTDAARAKADRQIDFVKSPFVQKELAATLQRIADKGASDFYDGEIAAHIVDAIHAAGGILSLRDLREYKPVWRAPIRIAFREFDLYTLPPPSAAGLMLTEELNILSGYDLDTLGSQSAATVHLIAEASRRAAIDRDRYLGDTTTRMPYRDLFSAARAAQWRASINPTRVTPTVSLTEPASTIAESLHTTHFTVADSDGNIAAITTTLGDDFGSGLVVPKGGFLLNDAMHDFATNERSPNVIAGGRRMATSLAPTIILRRGRPYIALGSSGGAAIPNIVLQTFLGIALFGKSLNDSIAAPRYDQQSAPEDITYESLKTPEDVLSQLRTMGHGLRQHEPIGDVHALMFDSERITAVSDPRHGGSAGGY